MTNVCRITNDLNQYLTDLDNGEEKALVLCASEIAELLILNEAVCFDTNVLKLEHDVYELLIEKDDFNQIILNMMAARSNNEKHLSLMKFHALVFSCCFEVGEEYAYSYWQYKQKSFKTNQEREQINEK